MHTFWGCLLLCVVMRGVFYFFFSFFYFYLLLSLLHRSGVHIVRRAYDIRGCIESCILTAQRTLTYDLASADRLL